jgi:hypothetical protein
MSIVLPEAPADTVIEPGLELSVKLAAGAAAAVPVSEAVCGLPAALSAIEIEPVLLPAAVGLKTTVIVHVALCATDVPQVLVWLKSPEFVPVMPIEVILSEALPVLDKVMAWLALAVPTVCEANIRLVGVKLTLGALEVVPVAIPVSEAVCGLPIALSVIETEALRLPVAIGLKTTVTVQVALCATDVPQVLVSLKSPEFVPVMLIEVILSEELPVLDRVIAWLALAVPTVCEANIRLVGARLTFGAVEALPVPVSGTDCGLPVALSATDRLAVSVPVAVGLNSMETAQFAPDASELVQVFAEIT